MRTRWSETDLAESVIAVPPLARTDDLSLHIDPNAALMRRLADGGVSTFLYGGNANLYHTAISEYPALLDMLAAIAPANAWIIPSAGPDFGKLMDQAAILKDRQFPLVMILPGAFPARPDGILRMIRDFAARLQKDVLLYLKTEMLTPAAIGTLFAEGTIAAVKYAIPRSDPAEDSFLEALLTEIPASRIVSGFGEMPALAHMKAFGLAGFTTGSACVAPQLSSEMLLACRSANWNAATAILDRFSAFEALRDQIDPIGVLHYALGWAGLEEMGPILPAAGAPDTRHRTAIEAAARALIAAEYAHADRHSIEVI